jgi:hypothetical protein
MALKAVLIDLDDTLIVDEAVSREAFEIVARCATRMSGSRAVHGDAANQAKALWAPAMHLPQSWDQRLSAHDLRATVSLLTGGNGHLFS